MKEETDSDEINFEWNDYLKQTGSEAAPASCFRQRESPPPNEFKVGHKLETVDPRNRSSMCIASVVETQGPRIRLRLDGTDDRNDFWLLVDSEHIHPFEWTTKQGDTIKPPLGFRNNLSTWPRFYDKIVQLANESTFAPELCFKQPPGEPQRNEFKKGQKIEAIDVKNPHLICPATVTDVDKDQIHVAFDGWSQASSFWCNYASRDIFPVGWCKRANHTLQSPGNLEEKMNQRKVNRRSLNSSKMNSSLNGSKRQSVDAANLNETRMKSPQKAASQAVTSTPTNAGGETARSQTIDLSLVKSEKIEHEVVGAVAATSAKGNALNENKKPANANAENGQVKKVISGDNAAQQKANNVPQFTSCVYVTPKVDVGEFIDKNKFHTNFKKFGPATVKQLFKSVLEACINCAYDSSKIFQNIQDGKSSSYMKYKTANKIEKKYLPRIDNEEQLWYNLKLMSKLLQMDEHLFTKTNPSVLQSSSNNSNTLTAKKASSMVANESAPNGHPVANGVATSTPGTLKSDSIMHRNSNEDEDENEDDDPAPTHDEAGETHKSVKSDEFNSSNLKMKRRSSSDDMGDVQNKIFKTDLDNPHNWDIEQVVSYVVQNDPNLTPHIDSIRYQEIDGRAFVLLTTDVMMKYMGLKLGPALKFSNLIEKLKKR